MTRSAWIAALAVALVCGGVGAETARAGELVEIPIPARNGEIADMWLPRYPNGGPPMARVLLPDGYDPAKAYPLLVLLVGLSSHYSDWSDPGQGEIASSPRVATAGTRTGGTRAGAGRRPGRATSSTR